MNDSELESVRLSRLLTRLGRVTRPALAVAAWASVFVAHGALYGRQGLEYYQRMAGPIPWTPAQCGWLDQSFIATMHAVYWVPVGLLVLCALAMITRQWRLAGHAKLAVVLWAALYWASWHVWPEPDYWIFPRKNTRPIHGIDLPGHFRGPEFYPRSCATW